MCIDLSLQLLSYAYFSNRDASNKYYHTRKIGKVNRSNRSIDAGGTTQLHWIDSSAPKRTNIGKAQEKQRKGMTKSLECIT